MDVEVRRVDDEVGLGPDRIHESPLGIDGIGQPRITAEWMWASAALVALHQNLRRAVEKDDPEPLDDRAHLGDAGERLSVDRVAAQGEGHAVQRGLRAPRQVGHLHHQIWR